MKKSCKKPYTMSQRIALELHDAVCQAQTGAIMHLECADGLWIRVRRHANMCIGRCASSVGA